MRIGRRMILGGVAALVTATLAGCASKFRTYNGPKVTSVRVEKGARKLYLLNNDRVLKSYDIGLGFAPVGHKQFEGDGKTPEGNYMLTYKNPKSEFHLSVRVSYPNDADRAYAASQGKSPGGDIVIHGGPNRKVYQRDWTAGCIAVTDREMEVIYSMIDSDTPISILP